jgi:hypothetical protein
VPASVGEGAGVLTSVGEGAGVLASVGEGAGVLASLGEALVCLLLSVRRWCACFCW